MYALLREHLCEAYGWADGMRFGDILALASRLPEEALREDRRRREYVSGVLARHELESDYPYNRRLFLRVRHGRYVLNPDLAMLLKGDWVFVYDAMRLKPMAELGLDRYREAAGVIGYARDRALRSAGMLPRDEG
jgi:hypothetical protein